MNNDEKCAHLSKFMQDICVHFREGWIKEYAAESFKIFGAKESHRVVAAIMLSGPVNEECSVFCKETRKLLNG
jgi:hypothetical protein